MNLLNLSDEISSAVIIASGTVLVSVISILTSKHFDRKQAIEQDLRNKKTPIYEDFIRFIFDILMSQKITDRAMPEKDVIKALSVFTHKLMVWGSDDVVKIWSQYRINYLINQSDPTVSILELEKVIEAIRKDIGHENKGFKKGDLLSLFVNDIAKYIK